MNRRNKKAKAEVENAKIEIADLLELPDEDLKKSPRVSVLDENKNNDPGLKNSAAYYDILENKITFFYPYEKRTVTHETAHYYQAYLTLKDNNISPKESYIKMNIIGIDLMSIYAEWFKKNNYISEITKFSESLEGEQKVCLFKEYDLNSLCLKTLRYYHEVLREAGAYFCVNLIHRDEVKKGWKEKLSSEITAFLEQNEFMTKNPFEIHHKMIILDSHEKLNQRAENHLDLDESVIDQVNNTLNFVQHSHAYVIANELSKTFTEKQLPVDVIKKLVISPDLEAELFNPINRYIVLVDNVIKGKNNFYD